MVGLGVGCDVWLVVGLGVGFEVALDAVDIQDLLVRMLYFRQCSG